MLGKQHEVIWYARQFLELEAGFKQENVRQLAGRLLPKLPEARDGAVRPWLLVHLESYVFYTTIAWFIPLSQTCLHRSVFFDSHQYFSYPRVGSPKLADIPELGAQDSLISCSGEPETPGYAGVGDPPGLPELGAQNSRISWSWEPKTPGYLGVGTLKRPDISELEDQDSRISQSWEIARAWARGHKVC